jgi:hypothetical protein
LSGSVVAIAIGVVAVAVAVGVVGVGVPTFAVEWPGVLRAFYVLVNLHSPTIQPMKLFATVVALSLVSSCGAGQGVTRSPGVRVDVGASQGSDIGTTTGERDATDESNGADELTVNNAAPESAAPPVGSASPPRPPLPSATNASGEIVLYNPETTSEKSGLPPNSNVTWGDKLTTAEQKRVIDALFPGKHLTSGEQCRQVEALSMSPEAQRASGYFIPSVVEAVAGAFTAPRTSETLYLVRVGECYAPHSEQWGKSVLAVLRGNTIVSRVPIPNATTRILLTSDLDGDGRDEILLASGDGGQGSYWESAWVVRMDASRLTVVKDWTQVVYAQCTAEPGGEKLSILYVTRGPHLRFRVETYDRPCHDHGY